MKHFGKARRGTAGGFTLVELLVVMGIIGLLIGLLIPAINYAITAARVGATRSTISGLSTGLYAFKNDWGVFPPSRKVASRVGGDSTLQWTYGFEALPIYLIGPLGNGWGAGAGKVSPFQAVAVAQYGPYYQAERGADITVVRDAFPPLPQSVSGGGSTRSAAGCILYYRFEPNEPAPSGSSLPALYTQKLAGLLDYQDNSPSGTSRPEQGFCNLSHFLLSVTIPAPSTGGSNPPPARWRSEDFVLISSGADRGFGTVKMGTDGALIAVTSPTDTDGTCDDVTSFNK
jgi:prepilin-type N-terminal cleavage/methylation domain-containing protein